MFSDDFMNKLDELIDALHEQSEAADALQESIEAWQSHILEINNITKKITFAEKKNNIWNPRFQTGKLYIQNKNP